MSRAQLQLMRPGATSPNSLRSHGPASRWRKRAAQDDRVEDQADRGELLFFASVLRESATAAADLLSMRKAFQGTMRHDLINGVEEILGRKVAAFMSDTHIDRDCAVEVFLLAPADAPPQGDGARGAAKTPDDAMAGAHP